MKLFEYKNHKLTVADEILTLKVFSDLHERDKSKGKSDSFKEYSYIYHMCDIKSDFLIINDEELRSEEVKLQVDLPEDWTPDAYVLAAMDMYKQRTISPTMKIYLDALKGALDTAAYLSNAGALLKERDAKGSLVIKPNDITGSLDKISKIIKDLKISEKEVIKEKQDNEGRMKGSQQMSIYEDGFNIN